MSAFCSLLQAVAALVAVYALALHMRRKKALDEGHSAALARIVTDLCLPAVILVNLAGRKVALSQLGPALTMLLIELACIALAWGICLALRFPKAVKGAVIFCAAFGSSTFLGYAVITEMFPIKPEAMTEAVLISEIGVGYPIFILGPMLAAYFGTKGEGIRQNLAASLAFFRSPVFFALALGLAWGHLGLPGDKNLFMHPVFEVCRILAQALTPLAILSVGLMFRVPKLRECLAALAVVVAIKLILKPLMLGAAADVLGYPRLWRDVLVVLGAMPSALLGVVFLRRYGGDASLASALLLAATILSCGTLVLVFWAVG